MTPRCLAVVVVVAASGCDAATDVVVDGGREPSSDADDAGRDAEEGASDEDAREPGRPGALTHVATVHEAIAERVCDLDGDGLLDSAIADLGGTQTDLFVLTLNAIIGDPDESWNRVLFHLPLVDDLDGLDDPETTVVVAQGWDTDGDRSDDFSGEEPFWVRPMSVDACGEPIDSFPGARLSRGVLETRTTGSVSVSLANALFTTSGASLFGTIEPGGEGAEWISCGYAAVGLLGETPVPEVGLSELTFLEAILAGGAALGIPSLPGLTPDVDLDGDGLERFLLSGASQIERCIDGDLSTIDGRDCWRDDRMADAISINLRFVTIPAAFDGLQPGWEEEVEGECTNPPAQSLWDPR